jgi:ComF family protein
MLEEIKNFILDILFPISCLSCGKDDTWFCPNCLRNIEIVSFQVCPYCEKEIMPSGRVCHRCKEKFLAKITVPPLDALIASASYKKSIVARLVHFYKYSFIVDLHVPLGKLLVQAILKNNLPLPDVILPVPLHPRRLRWRGFNQAELLAGYISENLTPGFSIPVVCDLLVRGSHATPQMKIKNYQERKNNIKGIFHINVRSDNHSDLKGKTILLIDDICTTGATLFECGKILKQNGAKFISSNSSFY